MGVRIAVINRSSLVSAGDVSRVAGALSTQVADDYSPVWGLEAEIAVAEPGALPASVWQLVILDDSDQANALGYHELTKSGAPLGKVFVRSVRDSGGEWSVAASHELLEMMAPSIQTPEPQGKARGIQCQAEIYKLTLRAANAEIGHKLHQPHRLADVRCGRGV